MKKLLSAILTICLVLSCTAPALAAAFPDLEPRHAWAEPAIEYMVSKGIINGYEDDTFRPDRTVTRAEFIKMLNLTFGLTATAAIPYTDVPADQWYAPYVKQAVAQGYLLNYGTLLNPNGALSRQEAAALLVRYLNPDSSLKAATTTFTDYSSIKAAYRDYVLLAAGIGLINGYEDDTFRPDKTLNRAEALAILYRAAGTICNDNLVESEAGAGEKNAVITKNNITVTGAEFDGRVIISEGVSGGTVTLSECLIGELIIRGTPTVILSGCTVDSLIVDCSTKNKTASISMLAGTTVKDMTLRTPADISTASRTTLTKLTVEEGAARSTFSGSGVFSNAVINATGFVSEKIPTNYTLAKGVSATFADKVYTSGSASSASDTGFSVQPTVYAASSYTYLTLTPVATGTVYYYYTNTASVPTTALFDNYYAVAVSRSSFAVTANRSVDTQIGATSVVGSYSYVVVRFTDNLGNKYQPVVISNRASDGFTVTPTVTTTGSYQYLSYTPAVSGSVLYYYTNSSAVPTVSSFTNTYVSNATSYRGELTAVAGQAVNSPTVAASSVSGYAYVAVMMMDNANKEYQPILVTIGGSSSASSTGFAVDPYCNSLANGVALGFTPTYSGTVEYYFTNNSNAPTASQFEMQKSLALVTMTGSMSVSAGVASYSPLLNTVSATTYPYIVVRLKTSSGMAYTPVLVRINGSSAGGSTTPGTAGSGFTTMPVVSYSSGKYNLSFQANTTGNLYYYLTNNPDSPGAAFMGNYSSATNALIATKLGGMLSATGGVQTLQTVLATDLGDDYDYMAIMLQKGSTTYTPVVVPVPEAEAVIIQDTGFVVGPVYNSIRSQTNYFRQQLELATSITGTVWYYFTEDPEVPTSAEVIDTVLGGYQNVFECGYEEVTKYETVKIPFTFYEAPPAYIVLMMSDANNNYYLPVVLSTGGSFGSTNVTTGFSGTPTVSTTSGMPVLNYTCTQTGKVYYFFTNSSSVMNTMWDFFSSTGTRGYYTSYAEGVKGVVDISAGKGTVLLPTSKSIAAYTHVAIMFQDAAYAPSGYRAPLVIALNGTGSSGSGLSDYSGFSVSPYLLGNNVYFTPKTTGAVYYGFTQTNSTSELYEVWDVLGGLGGYGGLGGAIDTVNISAYLATANGGGTVNVVYAGLQQSIPVSITNFAKYKYMALWTVDATESMSKVEFVPLGNTSTGGLLTGGSGFTVLPSYNSVFKQISFTPSVNGEVYYFYTNSNASYNTHDAFTTAYFQAYESSNAIAGFVQASAGQAGSLSVTVNNLVNAYKYVWVYMYTGDGSYTPVQIQLY